MTCEHESSYECVDPSVGDEIWQLDIPALDADLRRKLEAHVSICHACRMDRDLDAWARRLERAGELGDGEPGVVGIETGEVSVPASGSRLSWTGVDGAARYEVRVTGRDGDVD